MITERKFGILGGDFRQIHLARKILDNNKAFLFGFDKLNDVLPFPNLDNIYDVIDKSEYIILPLPETRDGTHLYCPFSKTEIDFNKKIFNFLSKKIVFGNPKKFIDHTEDIKFYDYTKTAEFQIMNSIPTAEGAIKIAMEEKSKTLFGAEFLIAGFGRIGKILANRLKPFGGNTTVVSRNPEELAWAKAFGHKQIHLNNLIYEVKNFDFIFNTIPSIVFTPKILAKCKKSVFIIDVASNPGGIDKAETENLKINSIHALGIPGQMFPESAATIIYDSIEKIIMEGNL